MHLTTMLMIPMDVQRDQERRDERNSLQKCAPSLVLEKERIWSSALAARSQALQVLHHSLPSLEQEIERL